VDVQQVSIEHETQIGNNWCWAASATMIARVVVGGYQNQGLIVTNFLASSACKRCGHSQCISQLHVPSSPQPDLPLCPSCNLRLLNFVAPKDGYKVDKNWRSRRSFELIKKLIGTSRPIEAYCCTADGTHAHFSIVHGTFNIEFKKRKLNFLMVADPWESGVGVCDFDTFVETGKYKRTRQQNRSLPRSWTESYI
jgi:hypothetical protein